MAHSATERWRDVSEPEYREIIASQTAHTFLELERSEGWSAVCEEIDRQIEATRDELERENAAPEVSRGYLKALRYIKSLPDQTVKSAKKEIRGKL